MSLYRPAVPADRRYPAETLRYFRLEGIAPPPPPARARLAPHLATLLAAVRRRAARRRATAPAPGR